MINNYCNIWGIFLARIPRASSLTPTTSIPAIDESSTTNNAKSIDDLIESLNSPTETTKSISRKKYFKNLNLFYIKILFNRSSKKSTATKELEDLMESLSNFNLSSQVNYS